MRTRVAKSESSQLSHVVAPVFSEHITTPVAATTVRLVRPSAPVQALAVASPTSSAAIAASCSSLMLVTATAIAASSSCNSTEGERTLGYVWEFLGGWNGKGMVSVMDRIIRTGMPDPDTGMRPQEAQ
ncbi:hypothetical protein RIF29_00215 [Crotalaria pallida]|uniref:Uncharacterized protein n=1 Tax=Crotalaria pallida TaxID=3830 RepID=A0AAN9IWE8_CROPI